MRQRSDAGEGGRGAGAFQIFGNVLLPMMLMVGMMSIDSLGSQQLIKLLNIKIPQSGDGLNLFIDCSFMKWSSR